MHSPFIENSMANDIKLDRVYDVTLKTTQNQSLVVPCIHKYLNDIELHNVSYNVHRGSYDALQER